MASIQISAENEIPGETKIANHYMERRNLRFRLGRVYNVSSEAVQKNKFLYGSIFYKLIKKGRVRFILENVFILFTFNNWDCKKNPSSPVLLNWEPYLGYWIIVMDMLQNTYEILIKSTIITQRVYVKGDRIHPQTSRILPRQDRPSIQMSLERNQLR